MNGRPTPVICMLCMRTHRHRVSSHDRNDQRKTRWENKEAKQMQFRSLHQRCYLTKGERTIARVDSNVATPEKGGYTIKSKIKKKVKAQIEVK